MANHGAGNKFVSVNLNKMNREFSGSSNSGSYGARVRSGGQIGGGGGMMVLSRPRSSQKTGQKLSVPSPVNLPSMRKEYAKFDTSIAGGGSAGGAAGSSLRQSSAGMGWTKSAVVVVQEKSTETISDVVGGTMSIVDGTSKVGSVYMPPARSGSSAVITSSSQLRTYTTVEKVAILRGEDFPSLHTSLSTGSGHTHKRKDGANYKSKQLPAVDLSRDHMDTANTGVVDMHPQCRTSQHNMGYRSSGNDVGGLHLTGPRSADESQKQESYIQGTLPEVRLNPRSDWADDERDTGQVFTDRSRNHGSLNNEGYWDSNFEMPRGSFMPPKPAPNVFSKWSQRDSEAGKILSSEVFMADPYNRDVRPTSREGRDRNSWNNSESHGEGRDISSWRSSSVSSIRANPKEHMNDSSHMLNENRFVAPQSLDRKNPVSVEGRRQRWNNNAEPSAVQGSDRLRNSSYQNGSPAKSTFSPGGKGLLVNDPILNFNKVKKPISNTEDFSLEDPFNTNGYDGRDPFSGGLVGVVKRKKDLPKLTDLHDPARESFEAELERVQKMQEQERKRAIEEQERAMLLARIEEEERLRLAREHEEMNRRLEEEARETAWRAEQEKLQGIQKAEELRIAREEEKQKTQMEEERRKQAAKQKLLELEERIARRQAEATREVAASVVNSTSEHDKEKETSRAADISDWEDGERMVERITTSASSDSSGLNRFVDSSSGLHSSADNSVMPVRERSTNSQRRDAYESEGSSNFTVRSQETPGREFPLHAEKSLTRKDVYGGSGFMYTQNYTKAGVLDPDMNDPFQTRGHKWSLPGDSIPEIDAEMHERFPEKLGEAGWRGSSSSHPTHSVYQERSYQNPELGEVYSYSRSRYSMRQPRVFPPPSISSMNRTLNRSATERPALLASVDRVVDSDYVTDSGLRTAYDNVRQENLENPDIGAFCPGHAATRDQLLEGNNSIRCDSQSSLSVTSPPSSPACLSHEDVEDSRGTPGSSADADEESVRSSRNNSAVRNESFLTADDEEWMVENRENLQQQEVYDEGGEYQEADEVHAENAADIDLSEDFRALNLEGKDSPRVSENLILGFNEGIEVGMRSDDLVSKQNENSKFSGPLSINHADSLQNDGHVRAQSTQMQTIDKKTGDMAVHLIDDPPTSMTSIGFTEAAASSGEPLPTFATVPVSQTVTSPMPAVNHPEVPVKLQFGLFPGPSLITSPVPSIQIGSIQMPLHLHPPVCSSLPHQSGPLFHFSHLKYNIPISQGVLPLPPEAISFVQPILPGQSANHNPVGSTAVRPAQRSSQCQIENNWNALPNNRESFSQTNLISIVDAGSNNTAETDNRHDLDVQINDQLPHDSTTCDPSSSTDRDQVQTRVVLPHQLSRERVMVWSKAPGPVSGVRGREKFYTSRSFGARSSNVAIVAKCQQGGNQIRMDSDRRLPVTNEKMNFGPRGARKSSRNGARRGFYLEKPVNQTSESIFPIPGIANAKDITSGSKVDKGSGNSSSIAGHDTSQAGEGCHKRNIGEDIDVTLQSGVVRVYDQPGIEVPSDEDDFIEVRSKRQMLNDRREQREKDNKANFRVTKNLQKPRFTSQTRTPRSSNKILSSLSKGSPHETQSSFVATEDRSRVNAEASVKADSISISQPLAPIGTPSMHSNSCFGKTSQSVRSVQASRQPDISTNCEVGPGSTNENKSKAMENVEASSCPWNNVWVNQQVMPLTQSQLDDAMNPGRLDAHGSYSGKTSGSIGVPVSSSSCLISDKSFSLSASPVNSLLAGKKIQFGAVTSPSIIPPSNRVVSQGIGSGRSDQMSYELSTSENVHSLFNVSEKHSKESSSHTEVSESEAKVVASAIAAATNDVLGTGAGRSVNVSAPEGLKQAANDGNNSEQKSSSQSRTEESLSVSLPADLSIEMSPNSVWQPLQSPQNALHHAVSHFPGGRPSHFPFYEMNPMVGGSVFAVGPSDDASGSQTQSQNNITTISGSLGPWQQRHLGPDSFHGHPAGFAPFISQPGEIPGAQCPPHMVVYNHFAPVGQFGQVGLSFMGTTYVPYGKQPDWKHNPTSSVGEENTNSMVMIAGQHIHHNTPAPIQHLASGSSLLPVVPPLAMYDVSPYQQSSDMSCSARWSHVPPQHLHSMPQLLPLQPHPERLMHPLISSGSLPDQSAAPATLINRFPDSQPTSGNNYPLTSSGPASQFPAELGLFESSSGSAPSDPSVAKSCETLVDPGKIGSSQSGGSSQSITSMKILSHQQKHAPFQQQQQQQHNHLTGSNHHHRGGGSSQRSNSGRECPPNRRAGYHSRNQSSSGNEKSFNSMKVKQIYVPKQPATNGTARGTS